MLESIFSGAFNVALIVIGVGILIFVHELGHFIVAKWAGVKVEAFSLGFGPKLLSFKRGDTEYLLCAVPLGGYVKMAGESIASEDRTGEDYEFISKPPLTRAKIFVAGALMNFIFAFPICILVYLLGVNFTSPQVGEIKPDSAEWNADIQRDDIILAVGGEKIISLNDYQRKVLRTPFGRPLEVKLRRGDKEIITTIIASGSQGFGIFPRTTIINEVEKDSPAAEAGLRPGDEILAVSTRAESGWNWQDKFIFSGRELNKKIRMNAGRPIRLKVRHSDGQVETLKVDTKETKAPLYDAGLDGVEPPVISAVKKGQPAEKGGLVPGDRIISINGVRVNSLNEVIKIISKKGGVPLKIIVKRKDQEKPLELITPERTPEVGRGYIGVVFAPSNILGEIPPGSSLKQANLSPGDRIIKANDQEINSLGEVMSIIWRSKGKPVELEVKRGEQIIFTQLRPKKIFQGEIGVTLRAKTVRQQYPLGKAIIMGTSEVLDLTKLTVQLLWKLIIQEESPRALTGPVGIFRISYMIVQEGISKFLWLLALFSVNLALINLLPIPILDGGGILFTLIEKIKGSPVSLKIMVASQYLGLFLLIALFVFVTYNDIFDWMGFR